MAFLILERDSVRKKTSYDPYKYLSTYGGSQQDRNKIKVLLGFRNI